MSTPSDPASQPDIEVLSFRLDDQEYCLDIAHVREIRGWTRATPLPHAPPHLKGVINMRGTVLPVIDLGLRLGGPPVEPDEHKVIVVVSLGKLTAGLLVDAVSDILTAAPDQIQPAPEYGIDPSDSCLKALLMIEGKLIRILDLGAVLPPAAGAAA
ncbi:chemotaxis protein CheW [Paracoccus jeotgali]|uniref:Chemotaxis protein CheW n=1 Tax=Paracoccus jeotgali TaxID=2065379 RepID=A0A2K9MCD6_9RHOB|nr:chemotaxis protein CheW [Paracoccus jeotgali]AUM73284.1 chemotaxis protein CheW [Paracoccus jeotgali]